MILAFLRRIPKALVLASFEVKPANDVMGLDLPFDGIIGLPTFREFAELVCVAQIVGVLSAHPLLEAGAASLGKASRGYGDRRSGQFEQEIS